MELEELNAQAAELAARLKPKQRRFAEEYEKDGNATQAAIRAGFSEKSARSAGSRLLTNVDVLAYRRARTLIQFAALGISRESLAADLVEIKERCMAAKPVLEWDYDKHAFVETGEWQFNAKGATKAIEVLAEMIGGKETRRLDITGRLELSEIGLEERERILQEIAEEWSKGGRNEEENK